MWGFGMMFWLMPLLFFAMASRRRRWERWAMTGPGRSPGDTPVLRRQLEEQQSYIESLEGRIARLEEGLDFAERLLAERGPASR